MHIGLRGRLIAVLAFVSALTLAVAAVTLLSPLNQRLQDNTLETFAQAVRNERSTLTSLSSDDVVAGNRRLVHATRLVRRRTGAEVDVVSLTGRILAKTDPDPYERVRITGDALRTGQAQQMITSEGQQVEAQVAFPVSIDDVPVVLVAHKPIDDVRDAAGVVRRAFTLAAITGLAGALLVGLLLAGRLSGRIRRLRDTALRVAEIGPVAEFRPDTARDEIGDLSRAFATMQQHLREQEQARRAFVATASHELRTPLSSLSVMLDMLVGDLRAEPADVHGAETQAVNAERQVARLSQLAAELLDLSRIDAGIPLRNELVDLDAVLRSVVAELDVRLTEQGRGVDLDADGSPWAIGDPGSVAQIVRLLLDNALRHTTPPGGIRVRSELRDGMAAVVVEDDGSGVPPEDRERIFERFARGSQATEGGFGLGLAIGRELARRMEGDLTLEQSSSGARFALRLRSAPAP